MSPEVPHDVDAYIAQAPEQARPLLRDLRRLVLEAAPSAAERISYGMPTYEISKRRLLHFAATAKQVAVYALVHVDAGIPADLAAYADHRSTLHFPFDRPLPEAALAGAIKSKADALASG